MVLVVKNRFFYYKRYELDLWGITRTLIDIQPVMERDDPKMHWFMNHRIPEWVDQGSKKKTRLLLFFYNLWQKKKKKRRVYKSRYVYRIDIKKPEYVAKHVAPEFLDVKLVRLFYIIFNYRQLRNICWNSYTKQGFYEENFATALECRLVCFLYRTGLISNMFTSLEVIKTNVVLINYNTISHVNYKVAMGELLSFSTCFQRIVYVRLMKRLRKHSVFFSPPTFMFVSYKLLVSFLKSPATIRDLVFPVNLDLHAVVNYFGGRR